MEEQGKKLLAIAFVIVSIVVVIFVFSKTFFKGAPKVDPNKKVYLMCSTCGGIEITESEYSDLLINQSRQEGGMGSSLMVTCPKCGQNSCTLARKCEKCENIFTPEPVLTPKPGEYPDKCPKCGYSAIENRRKTGK